MLRKICPVLAGALAIILLNEKARADETVVEAVRNAKVCPAQAFLQAVIDDSEPECKMTRQGSTAALMGVLQAQPVLYLIIGDHAWWVTQASDWKVIKENDGL